MLETSKDLLFIVLAICIFGLTVFICWAIYYLVMILKQANQIIADFREKIKKIDETLALIKEKIEHSTSYLGLLVEGIRQMLVFLREKKEKRAKKEK